MFTILGADGKEYGPVTVAKVQEWIAAGRANLQTKVRRSGDTEWRTLGEFPEFGGAPSAQPAVAPVAAATAPAAATGEPVGAKAYAAEILAHAAPLDVFGTLGRSFELWKGNLLPLVGVTFLVMLMTAVLGVIPVLGAIANIMLNGVFYGGLYYYYLGKLRGEARNVGDAFAGFSLAPGPLIMASLLIVGLSLGAALVLMAPWIIVMAMANFAQSGVAFKAVIICGMLVCCLPLIYLSIGWAFTFLLVMDKGLTAWTAMEVSRRVISRNWFRMFFTMFLGGILGILGIIGLGIGVIFTLPLALGAIVCAYDSLCNPPAAAAV